MTKKLSHAISAHTPEPWKIDPSLTYPLAVVTDDDIEMEVCEVGPANEPRDNATDSPAAAERWANAARIVACVNACAGINPEAVPDLLAAAEAFDRWMATEFPTRALGRNQETKRIRLLRALRAALAKAKP